MKPPECPLCRKAEWRHVCVSHEPQKVATNAATNSRRTKNRRLVGDYNAYQRVYMAVRRAVEAGRADWWPRRV